MKTILMKFSGPMQAWGTSSHFETRHTDDHPSKSGVIGLVAAALGWRRDDARIASLNAMTFAVRVDQPGTLLKDYQTAHKVSKKSNQSKLISQFYHGEINMFTYVTSRYYLEDAVFTVALGMADSHQAEILADALQAPYFQPYMGRRALPLPVDFFLGVKEGDPLGVLEQEPWHASRWYQRAQQKHAPLRQRLSIYIEGERPGGVTRYRRDHLLSLSHKGRRYTERLEGEKVIEVEIPNMNSEHDAFGALGGE